jgi:hypothetical protein
MYALPPTPRPGSNVIPLPQSMYADFMQGLSLSNELRMKDPTPLPLEPDITDLTFTPTRPMGISRIPSSDFLYDYILRHPNTTVFGVVFHMTETEVVNVQYTIWYNSSTGIFDEGDIYQRKMVSLMRGLDEAICKYNTFFSLGNLSIV